MSDNDLIIRQLEKRIQELERESQELGKQLQQVEREQIQYLQNVSHQLVAPLNAIKWNIENLTGARVGVDRAKRLLSSVYSQATLAVHLAKNFNLMSNLEADHDLTALKEPLQEVDLRGLLSDLAHDFQPLGWDREINIRVDDGRFEPQPRVLAMKPLIAQVFSNLIENALKYSTPNTDIVIHGKYLAESDSFLVSIRNRGIPLRSEQFTKIFERGFRSDEAKQRYPAGTGFGLYIAKRIVEIHEGTITASIRDGWTVFDVALSVKGLKGKARLRD